MFNPLESALEKLKLVRDELDKQITELEIWVLGIINQTQEEAKFRKDRCEICNSKEDPKDLERHHITGRKYDYRIVTVCKTCHQTLTNWQKVWPQNLQAINKKVLVYYFWLGLRDILMLKSGKTVTDIHRSLAEKVLNDIPCLPYYFDYKKL